MQESDLLSVHLKVALDLSQPQTFVKFTSAHTLVKDLIYAKQKDVAVPLPVLPTIKTMSGFTQASFFHFHHLQNYFNACVKHL